MNSNTANNCESPNERIPPTKPADQFDEKTAILPIDNSKNVNGVADAEKVEDTFGVPNVKESQDKNGIANNNGIRTNDEVDDTPEVQCDEKDAGTEEVQNVNRSGGVKEVRNGITADDDDRTNITVKPPNLEEEMLNELAKISLVNNFLNELAYLKFKIWPDYKRPIFSINVNELFEKVSNAKTLYKQLDISRKMRSFIDDICTYLKSKICPKDTQPTCPKNVDKLLKDVDEFKIKFNKFCKAKTNCNNYWDVNKLRDCINCIYEYLRLYEIYGYLHDIYNTKKTPEEIINKIEDIENKGEELYTAAIKLCSNESDKTKCVYMTSIQFKDSTKADEKKFEYAGMGDKEQRPRRSIIETFEASAKQTNKFKRYKEAYNDDKFVSISATIIETDISEVRAKFIENCLILFLKAIFPKACLNMVFGEEGTDTIGDRKFDERERFKIGVYLMNKIHKATDLKKIVISKCDINHMLKRT
uniref:Asparagine-rich protein n=1 Tax=Rhabditophanes sp. KR3021 TaxID=114890 RepID=A0AC35UAQ4_9BILA